jgi:hypothetical protein
MVRSSACFVTPNCRSWRGQDGKLLLTHGADSLAEKTGVHYPFLLCGTKQITVTLRAIMMNNS